MEIIGIILICSLGYTLNLFINRWLYFQLQKKDDDWYPNPPLQFLCLLSLLGTFFIIIILLMETSFFKYKK
jgi:hypothetical protein